MTYPTLSLKSLANMQTVQENLRTVPDWLENSPYGADVRDLLKKLFPSTDADASITLTEHQGAKKRGRKAKGALSDEELEEVEKESKELLDELKKLKVNERLDTASKLNIIKLQTTLMEKIISVRERASNIKMQSSFQQDVLGILDDLLDEDQRHEFIKRMEAFL